MYFAIFDPYDEKYDKFLYEYNKSDKDTELENNVYDIDDCIICCDNNLSLEKPKRLTMINNLISKCNCNIIVHKNCLYEWIKKTNSCPICRERMILNIFEINSIQGYVNNFIDKIYISYLRWAMIINMSVWILYNFMFMYHIFFNYENED